MKKLFTFALLLVVLLGAGTVSAQEPAKFGHIDTNELLAMMPGREDAQQKLEQYAKELESQYTAMQEELQTKYEDFLANQETFSDLIRQSKERELTNLQQRIQEFQESAQEDLMQRERNLFNPIIEKARLAIQEVAKENNYTYIFDVSGGSLIYWEPSKNVMPQVKAKLGLE